MRRLIEEGDASGRRVAELEAALAAATGEAHGMSQRVDMAERRIAELEAALSVSEQGGCAAAEELTVVREALRAAEQRAEESASQASAAAVGADELARRVVSLQAELEALHAGASAERERWERATADAEALNSVLRKERQSAIEAMELLSQVQDKFSNGFLATR